MALKIDGMNVTLFGSPQFPVAKRISSRPFATLWSNRALIRRLLVRELQARYRGSMLGLAWTIIIPLCMVLMYTFVFGSIFRVRWSGVEGSTETLASFVLTGLILHQFLSENIGRAPSLVLENRNFVTRVVFPLEVLPAIHVGVALVGAAIGLVLLLCLTTIVSGLPAPTALLSPLVLMAMVPMMLGLMWVITAVGVFVRDLGQVTPIALSMLFFLGPVVYPRTSVPAPFDTIMMFNPITIPIESMRALIFGHPFPTGSAAIYMAVSLTVCWTGFALFSRLRKAFADVL